jgi:hypothetical protein
MILLLRDGADQAAVVDLLERLQGLGLEAVPLDSLKGRAFEILGEDRGRALQLRDAPAVAEILTRRTALVGGEPLWPHFALRLGILALLLVVALLLLAAFFPPGLGDAARPDSPPVAHGVEWYMRPAAGLVGLFPEGLRWIAGLAGLALWALLIGWPFLDRAASRTPGARATLRALGVGVALAILALGALA